MHDQEHGAHDHHHGHQHGAGASRSRLAAALAVTLLIGVGEVVVSQLSGSVALLADAGHMAADSAGLVIALMAARLSARPATDRSTWGLRRAEVIGAALQAGMLAVVGVLVAVRAVTNLLLAAPVAGDGMTVMGVVGLVANVVSLLILAGGRGESLNARAAFLEVAGDALGSVGVIVAGIVVQVTGWAGADAVASLLIVALIAPRALALLRAAGRVLMDFTPAELDLAEVRTHLAALPGVVEVHDLHAWTVSSDLPVLTAHVVVEPAVLSQEPQTYEALLDRMQACVAEHFPVRIEHATFQLEPAAHASHEPAACQC